MGRCNPSKSQLIEFASPPDSAYASMILGMNSQTCSPEPSTLSFFVDLVVLDVAVDVPIDTLLVDIQSVSWPSLPLQKSLVAVFNQRHSRQVSPIEHTLDAIWAQVVGLFGLSAARTVDNVCDVLQSLSGHLPHSLLRMRGLLLWNGAQ
jgi:hypothetical protein